MNFGDLISYRRFGYKHWAVYTGKNAEGQDVAVEFTGEAGSDSKKGATVRENLLEPGGIVNNQLDRKYPIKSEEEMKANIRMLLQNGRGKYNVLDNNCEHIATFVRYGTARSLQAESVLNTQVLFNNEIAGNLGARFS